MVAERSDGSLDLDVRAPVGVFEQRVATVLTGNER